MSLTIGHTRTGELSTIPPPRPPPALAEPEHPTSLHAESVQADHSTGELRYSFAGRSILRVFTDGSIRGASTQWLAAATWALYIAPHHANNCARQMKTLWPTSFSAESYAILQALRVCGEHLHLYCDNQSATKLFESILDEMYHGGPANNLYYISRNADKETWTLIYRLIRQRKATKILTRVTWIPSHTLDSYVTPERLQRQRQYLQAGGTLEQLQYNKEADLLAEAAHARSEVLETLRNAAAARARLACLVQKMYTHLWIE